ncbi:hypothetical protein EGR_10527 [Echinococcus granulosus]|uniref:Uncharacterized protein n=1 Tax=Echinococcus granulosus TaxID=6210 RepID=W6U0I0_ECHGR|nr:hypothetical protein EGR_10527 [Echinococcus granulosus]EUB54620.1 hypothetical protein EGR_10527 [Echinococcus granulosus]
MHFCKVTLFYKIISKLFGMHLSQSSSSTTFAFALLDRLCYKWDGPAQQCTSGNCFCHPEGVNSSASMNVALRALFEKLTSISTREKFLVSSDINSFRFCKQRQNAFYPRLSVSLTIPKSLYLLLHPL